MSQATIGFIGLGQMGVPMVRNLLRAGFVVQGFDLNPQAASVFASDPGFTAQSSPQTLAQSCEVVLLMLPSSPVVDQLLWQDGLAQQLMPGQIVLDMGSSDPVCSRDNFERLAALGIAFVDAPVSGGVRRAVDGSLSIMIGGQSATVEQLRPLLQAMGKTLVHVGKAGAGHAVKALNNYVSASGLLAVCESLVAAEKFGIDPHLVNQVFNASTGKNNTTEHKVENFMLNQKFNSGFALGLMRKDLQTAQGFIERMDSPADFASLCLQTWARAETELEPGADHTAMFKFVQGLKASA
ncbi:MAG: NAD(P)-dependent oxidoreductase [Burkholderiaceae bacterium]